MINAAIMLNAFLIILIFQLKNFASTGRVMMPTIIKVVMKTAIVGYPTPFFISIAQRGNATKPGIRAIEPIKAATNHPSIPESSPMYLMSVSFGTRKRKMLTKPNISNNKGSRFQNMMPPLFKASHVFCLLTMKEINRHTPVKIDNIIWFKDIATDRV